MFAGSRLWMMRWLRCAPKDPAECLAIGLGFMAIGAQVVAGTVGLVASGVGCATASLAWWPN